MPEHREADSAARKPVRDHPKPPPGVHSLNHAIRQELWYLDTVVAMPFRTLRRALHGAGSRSWMAEGLDELLWAAEGMTRLPVKMLQSAFGETLGQAAPPTESPSTNRRPEDDGEEAGEAHHPLRHRQH